MPKYHPPLLDRLVTVRNPSDKPTEDRDRYGTEDPTIWGHKVYANKRDQTARTSDEEGVTVAVGTTVWTIFYRSGIAPDAEVVYGSTIYQLIGLPVERGGVNGEILQSYLELHTTQRSGQATP